MKRLQKYDAAPGELQPAGSGSGHEENAVPAPLHQDHINQLTAREACTVLAALRVWQRIGAGATTRELGALADMEHFEDVAPLSAAEIDALCERINIDWTTEPAKAEALPARAPDAALGRAARTAQFQ